MSCIKIVAVNKYFLEIVLKVLRAKVLNAEKSMRIYAYICIYIYTIGTIGTIGSITSCVLPKYLQY